jgi:hypothetical protein
VPSDLVPPAEGDLVVDQVIELVVIVVAAPTRGRIVVVLLVLVVVIVVVVRADCDEIPRQEPATTPVSA